MISPPVTSRPKPPTGVLASGDLVRRCRREYLRAMKKDSGCDSAQREPSSPHQIRPFCSWTKAVAVVPRDRYRKPREPPRFRRPRHPPASTAISTLTSNYPLLPIPGPRSAVGICPARSPVLYSCVQPTCQDLLGTPSEAGGCSTWSTSTLRPISPLQLCRPPGHFCLRWYPFCRGRSLL